MCNFGKGHYEEHCEVILNLDQWFWRSCRFKEISSFSSVPASLVEGTMGNINMKLFFKSGPVDQERRCHLKIFLRKSLFSVLVAILFLGVELFVQLW